MQILTLKLRPIEITLDLPDSVDPIVELAGDDDPSTIDRLHDQIQDSVLDAVGSLIVGRCGVDCTVRVQQPYVPRLGLVDELHTEPF